MFLDNQNFEKIGEDIWVYHNFLSQEEIDLIISKVEQQEDSFWFHKNGNQGSYAVSGLEEVAVIPNRIQGMLDKDLFMHAHCSVTKMSEGHNHGVHFDSFEFLEVRELSNSLNEGDCFVLVDDNIYGMVVYLNDNYEGGEIYYTKQDVVYKPKAGDFLVHSSDIHCEHGVKSVKSGIRYSYPSSIRRKIKNPC